MKPILPKIHLVDLSEWPTCFNGLEARCKKPLEKARMEMGAASHVVQEKMTEAEFFPARTCRKCLAIGPIQPPETTVYYVVGLVDVLEEITYEQWQEAS